MSKDKWSIKRKAVLVSAFIVLYLVYYLTKMQFDEQILVWEWDTANLILLAIVAAGWILCPGGLFYIAIKTMKNTDDVGEEIETITKIFIVLVMAYLFESLSVVSYDQDEMNRMKGLGIYEARWGQRLIGEVWFGGISQSPNECNVILTTMYYDGGIKKLGTLRVNQSITIENINITLLSLYCSSQDFRTKGKFEVKRANLDKINIANDENAVLFNTPEPKISLIAIRGEKQNTVLMLDPKTLSIKQFTVKINSTGKISQIQLNDAIVSDKSHYEIAKNKESAIFDISSAKTVFSQSNQQIAMITFDSSNISYNLENINYSKI